MSVRVYGQFINLPVLDTRDPGPMDLTQALIPVSRILCVVGPAPGAERRDSSCALYYDNFGKEQKINFRVEHYRSILEALGVATGMKPVALDDGYPNTTQEDED